tara:strand:+ start:140 stop:409 length:270 start_codon:yes stop_codon:yes gene_type:complete
VVQEAPSINRETGQLELTLATVEATTVQLVVVMEVTLLLGQVILAVLAVQMVIQLELQAQEVQVVVVEELNQDHHQVVLVVLVKSFLDI